MNKFEDRRPDGDNEVVDVEKDNKKRWNIGEWSIFIALVVISLTASVKLIYSGVCEMSMEQEMSIKDPSEMPEHRVKDDRGPGQSESTPMVAKPDTDILKLCQHDPNRIGYEIRKRSGNGENSGDTMTVQVFWKDGSNTVTDYVLSMGGAWLPVEIKDFSSSEEAENYLVGQNNGPMAAPY